MGQIRVKAGECGYNEKDRGVKTQFINSIYDYDMMTGIISELTTVKKISEITSKQVSTWTRRVEAERAQKPLTEAIKDDKEFDNRKKQSQKNNTPDRNKIKQREIHINCKYSGKYELHRWPVYDKRCSRCGKGNQFGKYSEARIGRTHR